MSNRQGHRPDCGYPKDPCQCFDSPKRPPLRGLMTASQSHALDAILAERTFQDEKFGPGSQHTIGEWIIIMEAELAEAKMALIKGGTGRNSVLQEIVQVCAVGMACLEQHGTAEVGRMQAIVKELT